jgi:hypothetical protein
MRITEEFAIQGVSGKTLILQEIADGITYLDFGMTHLPRDFKGFRVKYTDHVAEPQADGTFRLKGNTETFKRL